jgi:hypothetical protein
VTSTEPAPIALPHLSTLARRLYNRLPNVYRQLDRRNDYALLRYIGALCSFVGQADDMLDELRGARPVGPATPEPWDLDPDELARWRANRVTKLSMLGDPARAPVEWLPYLAQLSGAYLHPAAGEQERRDTIAAATSGFRAGSRAALAAAARSALTGSRYVSVTPNSTGQAGSTPTMWDVLIRTRSTETPDPQAVIDTIVRKGAKPAGVKLWYGTFGTSWDKIEALFPTWDDWEKRSWDQIEEGAATYADVVDNLAPGPSFETAADIAKWAALAEGGGSAPTWGLSTGNGVDGANAGRLTKVGATGGMAVRSQVITGILQNRDYLFAASAKPSVALNATLRVEWLTGAGAAVSTTVVAVGQLAAADWNRSVLTSRHTAPANAAQARLQVVATGTVAAATYVDVDAALFRIISASGG